MFVLKSKYLELEALFIKEKQGALELHKLCEQYRSQAIEVHKLLSAANEELQKKLSDAYSKLKAVREALEC